MMKMMKKYISFLAAVAMLASCAETPEGLNPAVPGEGDITIQLTHENDPDADLRAQVQSDLSIAWEEGDNVSFYKGVGSSSSQNRLGAQTIVVAENGSGSITLSAANKTTLTNGVGQFDEGHQLYYCQFPATTSWISADGVLTFSVWDEQTYEAGDTFSNKFNHMVAASESLDVLKFKNTCGYLRLYLTSEEGKAIKSITIKSNNDEEKIAGQINVILPTNDEPEMDPAATIDAENGKTSIKLVCGDGVTLSSEPTPFWFVVPPTTLYDGFTVKVVDVDGVTYTKKSTNTLEISRNTVQNTATLDLSQMKVQEGVGPVEGPALIPVGTYVSIFGKRVNSSAAGAASADGYYYSSDYNNGGAYFEKHIWQPNPSIGNVFRMDTHGNQANNPNMSDGNATGSWLEFTLDPATLKIAKIEGQYFKTAGDAPYATFTQSTLNFTDMGGYDPATGNLTINLVAALAEGKFREYSEVIHPVTEEAATPYLATGVDWDVVTGVHEKFNASGGLTGTVNYGLETDTKGTKVLTQPYKSDPTFFRMDKYGSYFTASNYILYFRINPTTKKVVEVYGWATTNGIELVPNPQNGEHGSYDPATETLNFNCGRRTHTARNLVSATTGSEKVVETLKIAPKPEVEAVIPQGTYKMVRFSRYDWDNNTATATLKATQSHQKYVTAGAPYSSHETTVFLPDETKTNEICLSTFANQGTDCSEGNADGNMLKITLDPTTLKVTAVEGSENRSGTVYGYYEGSAMAEEFGHYNPANGQLVLNIVRRKAADNSTMEYRMALSNEPATTQDPYIPTGNWTSPQATLFRVNYDGPNGTYGATIAITADNVKAITQVDPSDGSTFYIEKFGSFGATAINGQQHMKFTLADEVVNGKRKVIDIQGYRNAVQTSVIFPATYSTYVDGDFEGSVVSITGSTIPESYYDVNAKELHLHWMCITYNKQGDTAAKTGAGTMVVMHEVVKAPAN